MYWHSSVVYKTEVNVSEACNENLRNSTLCELFTVIF